MSAATQATPDIADAMPRIARRVLLAFSVLAGLSLLIYIAGTMYGRHLSATGHTTSTVIQEIVIGNDVYDIPSNMIRHRDQRHAGVTKRVDLQVHWPTGSGYTEALAPAFSEVDASRMQIVMVSLLERRSLLDMADRFEPVYRKAIAPGTQRQLANGLMVARLSAEFGYVDEDIYYSRFDANGRPPFVARCQKAAEGADTLLLSCETDIFVGNTSEMRVRFAYSMLDSWEKLAGAFPAFAEKLSAK